MTATTGERSHQVEDLSWSELDQLEGSVPYWILPVGSVEQHGPHLPLGADALVVERLAEITARRDGALVLPSVRVGVLHAFRDWPGLRVPPQVLIQQVLSYADLAVEHGNRLLVLNGHDENHEPLMVAARELVERSGTDIVVVEWAQLVSDVIRDVSTSTSESHAGEALTSLFLHWYPERVRTALVADGTRSDGGLTADDLHVAVRAHRPRRYRRQDVPSGVLGDPRPASATKGHLIAQALVSRTDLLVQERGWR
jgi:creatinine amidohydrolase